VIQQEASDLSAVTAEQIRGSNIRQEATVSYTSQVSSTTLQDQVTFIVLFFLLKLN